MLLIKNIEDLKQLQGSIVVGIDISKLPSVVFELEDKDEQHYFFILTPLVTPTHVGNTTIHPNIQIKVGTKEKTKEV